MDQDILVKEAQILTKFLDETKIKPRAVMWVNARDADTWRLWIVPDAEMDKREFYRLVSEAISKSGELQTLDVGITEYVERKNPAMQGMGRFIKMDGIGSAHFSGNRFNGVYLPDGIVIRMNL